MANIFAPPTHRIYLSERNRRMNEYSSICGAHSTVTSNILRRVFAFINQFLFHISFVAFARHVSLSLAILRYFSSFGFNLNFQQQKKTKKKLISGFRFSHFSNNGREARNRAEKNRRDKLNGSIQELSMMVPHVAESPRRVDKTAVLRFSAHGLRIDYGKLRAFQ